MPAPPRLSGALDADPVAVDDEASWFHLEVVQDLAGRAASGVDVRECRFLTANLTAVDLDHLRVVDSEFIGTELSAATLEEASFNRVVFRGCRMRGTILSLAHFRDVVFVDCQLDEAQFRMTTATGSGSSCVASQAQTSTRRSFLVSAC